MLKHAQFKYTVTVQEVFLFNINLFTLWKYRRICRSVQLSVQYRQLFSDQQLHAKYLCDHFFDLLVLTPIDLELSRLKKILFTRIYLSHAAWFILPR